MFELHPQLAADCLILGDLPLCQVLLMKDANYPWLILVPRRAGVREIYALSDQDQQQLTRESAQVASTMATLFSADKMNVAALGNMVPQLHIHHIARHSTDPAWPRPVWGQLPSKAYDGETLEQTAAQLRKALAL